MSENKKITIAHGDGVGPEIMAETLKILEAAGARLEYDEIKVGEELYLSGHATGIDDAAWASMRETGVLLKGPITTPFGGGYKSLNVTIRKTLGLFANVRPAVAYHPFVQTNFPSMDIVIVRENEEDLYAGIEHRQTANTYQCLKLLTRPGSERICRFAFEYAKANNRKKVTCMIKDNIMKFADGMFYEIFQEIAKDYPDIEADRMIVDIGAARVGARPLDYDVIVTPNLYGDIISDIAAEVTGSVGLGGSSNIGIDFGMFEAIHGSAPDIAGQGIANPSGLILGAVQMLVHIGQGDIAETVHNAWLKTLEDGIHTGDIYRDDISKKRVGTTEFGDAVVANLGEKPSQFKAVSYPTEESKRISISDATLSTSSKELIGVDIFINSIDLNGAQLGDKISALGLPLDIVSVASRGVMVYPNAQPEKYATDHYVVRFEGENVSSHDVVKLQSLILDADLDIIKTENLYNFDGERAYSKAQGQG